MFGAAVSRGYPVFNDECHDPVIEAYQAHAPRYPQVRSQRLSRRISGVSVVSRLGVEGCDEEVGANVEMVFSKRLDPFGHRSLPPPLGVILDNAIRPRQQGKGDAFNSPSGDYKMTV